LGGIKIEQNAIHTTADGKRLLVMHGDEFDAVVRCSPLLAGVGGKLYDWLLKTNIHFNWCRLRLGFPYWSLAGFLKHKVKNAVNYISKFESTVVHMAKTRC
jgi:UDP-2,3-diacylglucosamine pyrophosphatase LpxH